MTTLNNTSIIQQALHAFETEGYLILPNALEPATLRVAREAIADILQREASEKDTTTASKRSFGIAVKHPIFREIACHPLVTAIWRAYLGEDMILSTWSSNTVLPNIGNMGWHADFPYWAMREPWPQAVLTGQTLWMLDDFTPENGATALVPKSHLLCRKPDEPLNAPHPNQIIAQAPAGSVLLFDGRMWHSSRANSTQSPRTCLLGMYIRSCCIPMENMREQLGMFDHPTELETQIFGGNQRQPTLLAETSPGY